MRMSNRTTCWAVYLKTVTISKQTVTSNAVCEQAEWDAMDKAEPGVHTLVRGRIETEEEAEKLARGTSGDDYKTRKKVVV